MDYTNRLSCPLKVKQNDSQVKQKQAQVRPGQSERALARPRAKDPNSGLPGREGQKWVLPQGTNASGARVVGPAEWASIELQENEAAERWRWQRSAVSLHCDACATTMHGFSSGSPPHPVTSLSSRSIIRSYKQLRWGKKTYTTSIGLTLLGGGPWSSK